MNDFLHLFLDILKDSVLITVLVMVMMLLLEFVNVHSHGKWFSRLRKNAFGQVVLGAGLGLIPGCMGGFAVVSMYSHKLLSFGALVAMMIASSGDEAFVMLAMIPKEALLLMGILFVVAVAVGLVVDKCSKSIHLPFMDAHEHDIKGKHKGCEDGYQIHKEDEHENEHRLKHIITEHLWNHIIRKHFLSIFLWTFGALLVIKVGLHYFDIETLISNNIPWMILLAILIGIIPDSGPHLLFVTLFATGTVPFSVLLASSISQDGHAALPLLAESKRSFVKAKIVNALVAAAMGYFCYFVGF